MKLPVVRARRDLADELKLDSALVADWLEKFLVAECVQRRGVTRAVLGLSGGVDSAVVACLCARAFGPENVHAFRLPFRLSSPVSLEHAHIVVERIGIVEHTIDITAMVDGYATLEPEMSARRLGNVCARARMAILFDQSAKLGALPIGTGNKSERLLGYFTWHADDAPPINPLGDLFKLQVWDLARHLELPAEVVEKPPTADLVQGQTDEGDIGIPYHRADRVLHFLTLGYDRERIVRAGCERADVDLVAGIVESTHWKRHLPTVAMLSPSAVNEFYLRPVDY